MKKISFEAKFSRDKKTLTVVGSIDDKVSIDKKLRGDWVKSYHDAMSTLLVKGITL